MERLLVTGIDSPLGANLALALADRADVLGLYDRQPLECAELTTAPMDRDDPSALECAFRYWKPRRVVHCGPLAASSWDPHDDAIPGERERRLAVDLADLASEHSASLTVVSSDVVFAGPRMFHEESAPLTSPSRRAAEVREMERAVQQRGALVVRTHAYGWSPVPERADFAQRAYESLAAGTAPRADGRRHATPILATDLAELLWRAYDLRAKGLIHLAGAERASTARFIAELAAAFGMSVPEDRADAPNDVTQEWHHETSLNSRHARRLLECSTPLLREGLDRFALQAASGWRERWRVVGRTARPRQFAA